MADNINRPPTASGEALTREGLATLYEAIGMPPDEQYLSGHFITSHVVSAVATTFSNGELAMLHAPSEDPVVTEHFGVLNYATGTFGSRLRELLEGDDVNLRSKADGLIRVSAEVFAHSVVRGDTELPDGVKITVSRTPIPNLGFDGTRVMLPYPPGVVIDYGPGVKGRFHIDSQIDDMQRRQRPFTYFAIDKGPFINEFLMCYWQAQFPLQPHILNSVIGRAYFGREDGIKAATDEFIASQTAHAGSPELADVVIASAIQSAGSEEVEAGIANAHKLLRPDGILLVRAPKAAYRQEPHHVAAETMIDMALEAGFAEERAQFIDIETRSDFVAVKGLAAVFRK
ncbi:MAG TPA: hypothetical protein VJR27_05620 [Candidatus Saccharimonadales bacterium]|nr:hypothetical protein [Candidatus Saccharimonadales bacterium]